MHRHTWWPAPIHVKVNLKKESNINNVSPSCDAALGILEAGHYKQKVSVAHITGYSSSHMSSTRG